MKGQSQPPVAVNEVEGEGLAVEEAVQLIRVGVNTTPVDAEAAAVAQILDQDVRQHLVRAGFSHALQAPEVAVTLRVASSSFDRSGNYHVMAGTADAEVGLAHDGRSLGSTRFSARGERALGREAALDALGRALGSQVAPWVVETCTPARDWLVATDISVNWSRFRLLFKPAEYARRFIQEVGGLDGVVACNLVRQDPAARNLVFRVAYHRGSFPEGLLNRVAAIQVLNIKP
jgi:hypothetical protein